MRKLNIDLIQTLRIRKGWSQRRLAKEAGITANTMNFIENREVTPYPGTLKKIADALEIEADKLLEEEESRDLQKVS